MQLQLGKLGSKELKELSKIVRDEQDRRSKKNPANHAPPTWTIPNEALAQSKGASPTTG